MKTLIKSNKNQIELRLKTKENFHFFSDEKLESFSSFLQFRQNFLGITLKKGLKKNSKL